MVLLCRTIWRTLLGLSGICEGAEKGKRRYFLLDVHDADVGGETGDLTAGNVSGSEK